MGIIKKISSNNNSLVCIWKITETYDELELLTDERLKIKSRLKQKEFLASRILVKKICQLYNALQPESLEYSKLFLNLHMYFPLH